MNDLLLSTLSKILLPAFAIAVMLFAARRRRLSYGGDLGLRAPEPKPAFLFLVLWVCLMIFEEYVTQAVDGAQAKPWPVYPTYIVFLRVLAIGLLGPIAEELAFRGVLMGWLCRTRIGFYGAIFVAATLWSVVHFQYAPVVMLIISIDGIVLGMARHFSKSLLVPITMHIMGNCFSIYQSVA